MHIRNISQSEADIPALLATVLVWFSSRNLSDINSALRSIGKSISDNQPANAMRPPKEHQK